VTYRVVRTGKQNIDQHLNLGENFDHKFKKASSKLQLLKRLQPLLTHEAAIAVYKSVIISALKYNCIVQLNLTRTQRDKLKSLERRASNILNTDDIPSIQNDFCKHAVKLVRKCMEGKVCENFVDYFQINEHNKNTRNKNILLTVPKIRLELARSGFFSMGAKLYNLLPREIRQSESGFDNKLTNFSFDFSTFKT